MCSGRRYCTFRFAGDLRGRRERQDWLHLCRELKSNNPPQGNLSHLMPEFFQVQQENQRHRGRFQEALQKSQNQDTTNNQEILALLNDINTTEDVRQAQREEEANNAMQSLFIAAIVGSISAIILFVGLGYSC